MDKTARSSLPLAVLVLLSSWVFAGSAHASTYDLQKAFVEKRFGMFIHFRLRTVGRVRESSGDEVRRSHHQAPRRLLPMAGRQAKPIPPRLRLPLMGEADGIGFSNTTSELAPISVY